MASAFLMLLVPYVGPCSCGHTENKKIVQKMDSMRISKKRICIQNFIKHYHHMRMLNVVGAPFVVPGRIKQTYIVPRFLGPT
jgi:hypothetical protein